MISLRETMAHLSGQLEELEKPPEIGSKRTAISKAAHWKDDDHSDLKVMLHCDYLHNWISFTWMSFNHSFLQCDLSNNARMPSVLGQWEQSWTVIFKHIPPRKIATKCIFPCHYLKKSWCVFVCVLTWSNTRTVQMHFEPDWHINWIKRMEKATSATQIWGWPWT